MAVEMFGGSPRRGICGGQCVTKGAGSPRKNPPSQVIVVDELGYIPFDATLIFPLVSTRNEQGSIMVTSDLPFGKAHMFARICA